MGVRDLAARPNFRAHRIQARFRVQEDPRQRHARRDYENAVGVRKIGADYLLEQLKGGNRHWRGRVLECLLTYDRGAASRRAEEMPWEFTYAVGRSGQPLFLPAIRKLLKSHKRDVDFVPIYIWALGKMGAAKEIDVLDRFVRRSTASRAVKLSRS